MQIPEWLLWVFGFWALVVSYQLVWVIQLLGKTVDRLDKINGHVWDGVRHQPWHADD